MVNLVDTSKINTLASPFIFEASVVSGTDDAEERASGTMALESTDLDFVNDRLGNGGEGQYIGIRFTGIEIPPGAVVTGAYLQFHTDEVGTAAISLLVQGEDVDDAAAFADVENNITSRPTTDASSAWTPEAWSEVSEAGAAQRTPDLSAIVQEIVARPGWQSGNDLAFIISGTSSRTAEAFEGHTGSAPVLHIEWVPGGTDTIAPDVVMDAPKEGAQISGDITLSALASDNVGVVGVQFQVDGDSIGNLDTTAPFSAKLDTTRLADGEVAFSALATDAAGNETVSAPVTVLIDNGPSEPPPPAPPSSGTIRVPEDYPTIQKAVDAAGNGDTILVGPGTYAGDIVISGKSITLASYYQVADDPGLVDQTIIKGGSPGIFVDDSAPNTTIAGFHFVGGEKSVQFFAQGGQCLDNFFDHPGGDAISFESAGGVARGNLSVGAGDDAVDVDAASANVLIERNIFRESGDDGIEIRNQNYQGSLVTHTIRGNTITGSDEDGIQLIDYSAVSDRAFVIEGNLIQQNADVGLGIMDNGETREDFRGASMPERVDVSDNTFDANRYGITGGDNLHAVNNTISHSSVAGLKNVDGESTIVNTTFIDNKVDYLHSNVGSAAQTSGTDLGLNDVLDVTDGTNMLVMDESGANAALRDTGDTSSGADTSGGVSGIGGQSAQLAPLDTDITSQVSG
ncbi:MAG TPA: right-handed parallel beta-helix repeat-containing protein [Dongiaceae bacterium]|jgi:hypothetical protein|nr:right-handed parallel beta-helix repeat-containing protein [Dongiaceae bacterium]